MTGDHSGSSAPVPFHRTPDPARPYQRRLLVISANFPPSRAVGGLRWQKMSHFAAERGWGTDVICLDPASMPDQDPERLGDLPPGMRIYGVRHGGPRAGRLMTLVARAMRRGRTPSTAGARGDASAAPAAGAGTGSVARHEVTPFRPWSRASLSRALLSARWVGGDLTWVRDVTRVGSGVIGPEHRVIVSSGPPHFAHEAGRRLAAATGLPHVADFRDPWSIAERVPVGLASPVYLSLVERYERRVVDGAALVVANTEQAARAMRAAYPARAERVVTVMNGSDDEPRIAVERDPRFLIAYAGAIYYDRDPRLLFRAAARVVAAQGLRPDQFGIEIMGPVDPMSPSVMDLARQEGIEPFVRYHPPGPRSASARLIASASMLVSLPQDTETAIPSKIFEYASYDAWLLALCRPQSASALVLAGSEADVVAPEDVDGIASVLGRHYAEFASGVRPRAVGSDGRFSRARQAAIMLDHLDRLTRTGG